MKKQAKKVDVWVRWSYRVNGWIWSVMQGAKVLAEGSARSAEEARIAAANWMVQS